MSRNCFAVRRYNRVSTTSRAHQNIVAVVKWRVAPLLGNVKLMSPNAVLHYPQEAPRVTSSSLGL